MTHKTHHNHPHPTPVKKPKLTTDEKDKVRRRHFWFAVGGTVTMLAVGTVTDGHVSVLCHKGAELLTGATLYWHLFGCVE